jgi:hypothetical protein
LIFVDGTGKKGAFKQVDYLAQVLKYLLPILKAFALITHALRVKLLFIKDGNLAHEHKSTINYYV